MIKIPKIDLSAMDARIPRATAAQWRNKAKDTALICVFNDWYAVPANDQMLADFIAGGGEVLAHDAAPQPVDAMTRMQQAKPPVPSEVTETQFMRASVKLGMVTAQAAEAYLASGVLPAFVADALDALPANLKVDARLKAIGSDTFHRGDEVFTQLIAQGAATSDEVDDLFRLAATL